MLPAFGCRLAGCRLAWDEMGWVPCPPSPPATDPEHSPVPERDWPGVGLVSRVVWVGRRAEGRRASAPVRGAGHGGGLQAGLVALPAIEWLGVVAVRQAVFGLWRFARDGAILIMGVAVAMGSRPQGEVGA